MLTIQDPSLWALHPEKMSLSSKHGPRKFTQSKLLQLLPDTNHFSNGNEAIWFQLCRRFLIAAKPAPMSEVIFKSREES